jgi:hypothetical protein
MTSFRIPMRLLLHYSRINSATQSEYHSDTKPVLDRGYIDDETYIDSNIGAIPERKDKNFRKADRLNFTYALKKRALMRYKEIYGDMLVPSQFVISINSTEFPKEVWKMKLGFICSHIRCRNDHAEYKDELIAIGFDYTSQKYSFDQIKIALLRYQELHGNMLVPKMFTIPMDSTDYLEEFHGMNLGDCVCKLRNSNSYADKKEELIALGFDFSSQLKHTYDDIEEALIKYKELHGDMLVPWKYVIPMDSTDYTVEVRINDYMYVCMYVYVYIYIYAYI